jgi:hypothetical protein
MARLAWRFAIFSPETGRNMRNNIGNLEGSPRCDRNGRTTPFAVIVAAGLDPIEVRAP